MGRISRDGARPVSTAEHGEKAESLSYPSPTATPWGNERNHPVCALKGLKELRMEN
ncbi:MAG: hypothetical protein LBT78_00980 [Tannerella sp.]|nr:hypothetical protein [Tannerella sp.]